MKKEVQPDVFSDDDALSLLADPQVKHPRRYAVYLLNDDFTPMDFVVDVLELFFGKNREQAFSIVLKVHNTGEGLCGVFPYELAETKMVQVQEYAAQHQYPLQCCMKAA